MQANREGERQRGKKHREVGRQRQRGKTETETERTEKQGARECRLAEVGAGGRRRAGTRAAAEDRASERGLKAT